jgi:hypothetical protein
MAIVAAACNSTTRLAANRSKHSGLNPAEEQQAAAGGDEATTTSIAAAGGSAATGTQSAANNRAASGPSARAAGPAASSVSAQAVSAQAINIGILVEDFDQSAAAFAIKDSGQGDQQAQAQAVINYINSHGGAAGRKLVPVFHHNDPTAGTFADQNQRACAAFTEDHKVFAVTPQNFGMDTLVQCLSRKGVPLIATDHVFGAWSDQTQMDQYADHLYLPGTMNFSRAKVIVDGLAGAGFFERTSRIGLLYTDSPSIARAVNQTVRPALAAHGFQLTDAVPIASPNSEADVSNSATGASSAVLRLRSEGVDRIFFLEGAGIIPFLFMPQAQAQGYKPRYGLSSYDEPEWLTQNAPAAQLVGSLGVGWISSLDVADKDDPGGNAAAALCLQIMRAAGQNVTGDRSHEHSAFGFCSSLFFLKAALDGAPSVDVAGMRRGVEGLGTSFNSALTFATLLGNRRHDGAASARGFTYDTGCSCFRYTGARWDIP